MARFGGWLVASLVGLTLGCAGDPSSPGPVPPAVPVSVSDAHVAATPVILAPVIDGVLNEGLWQQAGVLTGLHDVQTGDAAVRPTGARFAYERGVLYVAIACPTDTSIGPPRAERRRPDAAAIADDESVTLTLWPGPDGAGPCFAVTINAVGSVRDTRRDWPADAMAASPLWSGHVLAAARVERGQWQAELRIDLKTIGTTERPWRVQLERHDAVAASRSRLPAPAELAWQMPIEPIRVAPVPVQPTVLLDAERAESWECEGATVVRDDRHVAHGRQSWRLDLAERGGEAHFAPASRSLDGWRRLKAAVHHPGDRPLSVVLHARDADGHSGKVEVALEPGINYLCVPTWLLCRGLDARRIRSLGLSADGPARLWIDYVRLADDALSFHEQPPVARRPSGSTLTVRLGRSLWREPTTLVGVELTVRLYHTRRVRRVVRWFTRPVDSVTFGRAVFVGHDRRDPVRVAVMRCLPDRAELIVRPQRLDGRTTVIAVPPGAPPPRGGPSP